MSAIGTPNAGTATTAATGNTSLAVPFPATTTKGTLLTLSFSTFAAGTTVTTPSGWTLIAHVGSTGDTLPGNVNLYRKIADGTEGGTSLTITHSSAAAEAQIVEWAAVDPDTPLDVTAVTLDQTTAAVSNVSLPLPTTVSDDCTLYYVITSNSPTQTATQPAGWTELSDGSGASINMESAYLQNAAIGAHGNVTVAFSGGGKQVAIAVALRPTQTVPAVTPRRPWFPQWFRSRRQPTQTVLSSVLVTFPQDLPRQPGRARDMMRVGWIGRRRGHEYVVPPIAYHPQKLPPQPPRPRDMMRVGWIGRRRGHEYVVPPIAYHPQALPPQPARPRDMMRVGWQGRKRGHEFVVPPIAYHAQKLPPQPQVIRHSRWMWRPARHSVTFVPTTVVAVTTQALPPQTSTRQPRQSLRPLRRPTTFVPPSLSQAPPSTSWRRSQPPRSRVRMYRRGVLVPVPVLTLAPPATSRVRLIVPPRTRRARFVNPIPTAPVTTSANAEAALANVGAFDATISILVNAETTTVASTSLDATASIAANAELTSVLIAAYDVATTKPLPGVGTLTDAATGTSGATNAAAGGGSLTDQATGRGTSS